MAFTAQRFQRNQRLDAAANNSPPLRQGESGEAVETLQQALIDLGFRMPMSTAKSLIPDGIYGPETEATVRDFQASNGLVWGLAAQDDIGSLQGSFDFCESGFYRPARMVELS